VLEIGLPVSEARVEKINLYDVYLLGHALGAVKKLNSAATAGDAFLPLWDARDQLRLAIASNSLTLEFAKDEANSALGGVEMAMRDIGALSASGEIEFEFSRDQTLPMLEWVKNKIDEFQTTFAAEMRKKATYVVPKRGSYDTGDLVDNAEAGALEVERLYVGELALTEYRDAGRCFAFGLHTAAGFHACRAVEAVINVYLQSIGNENLQGLKTWGDLIDWLEKLKDNNKIPGNKKPSPKTIAYIVSFLRPLKDHDRNLLMHVRTRYDITEAESMLGMTKAIMLMMATDMRKSSAKPQLKEVSVDGQEAG
jgi:hypothetical protein